MKVLALRGLLLVLLLTSLLLRHQTLLNRDQQIAGFESAKVIAGVIGAAGIPLRENPVRPPRSLSHVVYYQRPGCSEHSFVMPFTFNFDATPYLSRLNTKGYNLRFYYLDGSWPVQDRIQMFLVWLKHTALSIVGASSLLPTKLAIVRAEPEACAQDDTIDWRQIWDRARFEKAMAARKATPAPAGLENSPAASPDASPASTPAPG